MQHRSACVAALLLGALFDAPAIGGVIYNNMIATNAIATASRPSTGGVLEIETADDFVLTTPAIIDGAHFLGLLVPNPGVSPTITQIVLEIYRVFPLDSQLPGGGGVRVPTRANSPSDVELVGRDSSAVSDLTFSTSQIAPSFTALNSVAPGGIHPMPNQNTFGNGPQTGAEIQFNVSLLKPLNLPPDHYFFVPQVAVTGGTFYWLSASRPISGVDTTPFPAGFSDLQSWTRDANLDPDWLRIGADIVGGGSAFNAAFALDGTAIPEPGTWAMLAGGLTLLVLKAKYTVSQIRSRLM